MMVIKKYIMKKNNNIDKKTIFAITWLIFTVSLAAWWMRLGLQFMGPKRSMILSEGITLVIFILLGGVALVYYIYAERKQRIQVEEFFASTNHEVKTYIASVRLRAEGLADDLVNLEDISEAKKIVADTVKLEMQIENSLIFSAGNQYQIYLQTIDLKQYLEGLNDSWVNIIIKVEGSFQLSTDKRIFNVIIKNIIQNSIVHGKASQINITLKEANNNIAISFSNNGLPFVGDLTKLGILFYRHQDTSRSGIGLYLVKMLTKKLAGNVSFNLGKNQGLETTLHFPRGIDDKV
jgi:signal transduction histidine kinase